MVLKTLRTTRCIFVEKSCVENPQFTLLMILHQNLIFHDVTLWYHLLFQGLLLHCHYIVTIQLILNWGCYATDYRRKCFKRRKLGSIKDISVKKDQLYVNWKA